MKKLLVSFLVSLLVLTGCSTTKKQQETVVVSTINEKSESIEVEVPKNPEKVAIIDLASLDILDYLNVDINLVAMSKAYDIDYLRKYTENSEIINVGSLKEVNYEKLMEAEPDLIIVGGRLREQYQELSKIAPVVVIANNYEIGILESIKNNVATLAKIFDKEEETKNIFAQFESRITTLKEKIADLSAIVGLVSSSNFKTLGDKSRCSLITNELGFTNLANDVDATHGNESSFELLLRLNPDYIFVLDRDTAINAEGAKLAQEVMNNEIVNKTNAALNDQIIYLRPDVWYLSEGGLTALDLMLKDIENALN